MKNFLKNFVRDESGASAAEYVLILAIIGTGIAAGSVILGDAIGGAMERAAGEIDNLEYTPTP
ncbi:MAG: Flp family type IVb pilin [Sphingopyxis sp.]|uniref:Flp family type IVb pilin n=1 Tax=Sphingopyxis sp. TaxID=1908224 RepID=UPI001A316BB1|nr:Flp family type IVb pilin [Sphingopyxis sp.]MBJ7498789.1 Flp family type IVb pilin [Sphingopyxis sp.]